MGLSAWSMEHGAWGLGHRAKGSRRVAWIKTAKPGSTGYYIG